MSLTCKEHDMPSKHLVLDYAQSSEGIVHWRRPKQPAEATFGYVQNNQLRLRLDTSTTTSWGYVWIRPQQPAEATFGYVQNNQLRLRLETLYLAVDKAMY